MKAALLSWLKYSLFALAVLTAAALYLHGDEPLDTANWFGYWVFLPALLGVVLMLWRLIVPKRKDGGVWPS